MRALPVRLYSSFAARPFGGNIAGIVYDEVGLDTADMQGIAADLGAPTTGFVKCRSNSEFHVRFFSTRAEMGMCGHVTVGIFAALYDDGLIPPHDASYTQVTPAGEIAVDITSLDRCAQVSMKQPAPRFDLIRATAAEIAPMLGVSYDGIRSVASSSTALSHLFVELSDTRALASIRPDDLALRAFSKSRAIDTMGIWCLQSARDASARVRVRDLCHGVGDPEEAASGTTNGALASLIWKQGKVKSNAAGRIEVIAEQGFEMGRPSVIRSELATSAIAVLEVNVGGQAKLRLSGVYRL